MFELGEADHRNVRYEIVWVFFFLLEASIEFGLPKDETFLVLHRALRRNPRRFSQIRRKRSDFLDFFFVFQDFTYAVSVAQRIMNILIEMRFYLFLGNIRSYLHEYWARAGGVITIFSFSLVCLWWRWKFLWDNFTSIIISEFFEWKTYTYLFVYI